MCGRCPNTRPLLWKALFRVIAFFVITVTGGVVFSVVESSNAKNKIKAKDELLNSLRKEMEKKYNMTQSDFDNFTRRSNDAFSLDGPEWSFYEGLRYAFETLTTIGYGALAPSTSLGQGLCIIFSVLGIPIMILAFKSVGELISRGISSLIAFIESKCFKKQPSHLEAKCTAVTCVLMIIMLLLGATLQIYTDESEDMTFLVGFYFWFITFSTIGYGDYVPGYARNTVSSHHRNPNAALRSANIAFHLAWTTLGLCVVSSVLNAVAELIEKRSPGKRMCGKHCSCFYDEQDGSEIMDMKGDDSYGVKRNDSFRFQENDSYRIIGKDGYGVKGNESSPVEENDGHRFEERDCSGINNCDGSGKIQDGNYHSVTYV